MGESEDITWRIDRFVQSLSVLGWDLAEATAQEQGCGLGCDFAFLDLQNQTSHASHYYRQKLELCTGRQMNDFQDLQFRNRVKHFVTSKADLLFKLKGKDRLQSGVDYNIGEAQEAYSLFATQVPPLENGMNLSNVARRAQIFEILNVGDIILGKVVGKRPFGIFVRILSLVHGRNLDFNNIDIQALCPKSELEKDHKSREHLDPIDDIDIDDIVQGVICSISKDEERIAISFRSAKLPSEYGNIELGIIEDVEEHRLRPKSFDGDLDYNDYLRTDPGFCNPTNVQTLVDVLGIDNKPPSSLLRSCQSWTIGDKDTLRKQQSKKWSMDTTAIGVESFKNGDHDKALKYFNHALNIYEENSEALVARGALYANQNKFEKAIVDFKQALKLHPKHHNASKYLKETLYEKALRLKNVGNMRDAINIFEQVLELDPQNIASQEHLKELRARLAAKLVEDETKARKAASLLQENRKKFEHVRKLIKSDPDVVKSARKKKRKKKKGKKSKSKKRRPRSESETTSTASEAEGYDSKGDEWVEKDPQGGSPGENVVPGLRQDVQLIHSNVITVRTSEEERLEKSWPENKIGVKKTLKQTLEDSKSSTMGGAASSDTRESFVTRERRFSDTKEGRVEGRNVGRKDVERNLEGFMENFGGRQEDKEEVKHKEKEDRNRFVNVNNDNETIKNIPSMSKPRRHSSRSRSRSRSLEREDGALMSRSRRESGTRKKSGKKLNERDTDGGRHESIKGREQRRRNVRHKTRSGSDNSSRERTTKNFERDRSRIVKRRRSENSRGRRSTSRDSRGRRGSSIDSSSERDRSRSRSISVKRDRSRRRRSDSTRGRRSTSRDNGRRSTRRRSTSCSSDGRRSRSRGIRERRSISKNNRGRRSISKGRRRQRSIS